jgi:hypothetical protein
MSFLLLAAALVTARACISALEAEVNAAKVSVEKAAKLAENRAKKLKKHWLMLIRNDPSGSSP